MACLNVEYCRALSERQAGPVNGGGIRDHRGGVHLAPSVAERLFNYGHEVDVRRLLNVTDYCAVNEGATVPFAGNPIER